MGGTRRRTASVLALFVAFALLATPGRAATAPATTAAHSATTGTAAQAGRPPAAPAPVVAADITGPPAALEAAGRTLLLFTGPAGGQQTPIPYAVAGRAAGPAGRPGSAPAGGAPAAPFDGAVRTSWWGRAPPHA